jgi:hypothetical protein
MMPVNADAIEIDDIAEIDDGVNRLTNPLAQPLVDVLHQLRDSQQEMAAYRELLMLCLSLVHELDGDLHRERVRNQRLVLRRYDQRLLRIQRRRAKRAA